MDASEQTVAWAAGDTLRLVKMNPPMPIAAVATSQGSFPVSRPFGRDPSTACIHMQLSERLRSALKIGARDFSHALDCFDPCPGRDNSYPERMVSHYYIQALARALPDAHVLLEIAIAGKSGRGFDNHIDALVFNDHELLVAEFKVSWAPSHWVHLARDLERLRGPVAKQIRNGFAVRGRRPFIFLGTDCWYRAGADAWKAGTKFGKWILPESMHTSERDYLCVYPDKGRDFDGYYLTWALIPFREMAA